MNQNFTIKTVGSKKGTTLSLTRKLFTLLSLFLFFNVSVFADNDLDIIMTSTDVTCPGANDGTATVIPIDAWDPITYEWSNGETTPTITGLAPGIYEVTVIDADGAIEIGEVEVEEGDGFDLFLSASYETCEGSADGSASVNVSGGQEPLSYLWSTGETFVVASDLTAGTYTVTVTDVNGCSEVGSVEVELSPEGVWIMTSSTPADCGLNNGTAYASVMSGTAPFNIVWSDGQTGANAVGLAPGTYTVTATDANGCSNSESVVVEGDTGLSLDIDGNDADCGLNNGSATVTVNGGTAPYNYEWNTGGTTATITGLSAGTYSVTVTDDEGCSNVATIDIDEDESLDVDIDGVNADCNSNNGSATASVSGGTAPYDYDWSNGENTASISDLAPGVYSLTVTDANGCSDTESVTINGDGAEGGIISTMDELEICAGDGDDDIIDVTLSNNSGDNSIWVFTNTAGDIIGLFNNPPFNFENAGPGTCVIWHLSYQDGLTGLVNGNNVSDLAGCFNFSNSLAVVRTDPEGGTVSTNDDTNICAGDGQADLIDASVTGNSGTNQAWVITDESGNILGLPAAPPFNFENAGPGTCLIWSISYEPGLSGLVEGANVSGLDGCYELSSNFITVVRNETPELMLSETDILCNGDANGSITANASGGDSNYSYNWSNGGNTMTISGLPAGTYSVTVTDGNGCSVTGSASIEEPSLLAVTISGTDETCVGSNDGTASVNAVGGTQAYSYNWNNGGNSATITGLAPGSYTATVTDANGCTAVSNAFVVESNGIQSCSAMVTSSYNEGVDISTFGGSDGTASASTSGGTAPLSYMWSNGQTNQDAVNLSAGTYGVTITDDSGCTCSAEVTLVDPSKVGNFVWEDDDQDGIQDPGESGIGGVLINLTGTASNGSSVTRTTTSANDGSYSFDGLLDGNYKITFEKPSGYKISPQNAGGDDELDSNIDPDNGMTENFDLAISTCDNSVDAGLYPCVSIGDFVFYDGNRDGIQQPWEAGVPNASVNLMSAGPDGVLCTNDDVIEEGQITGGNGRYLFECVDPGTYYIRITPNGGDYMYTSQNQGGDDELDSDVDNEGKTAPFTVVDGMPDDLSFDAGVYLVCDDFTNGGQIGYDQEICPGELPDELISVSDPSGGYGTAEYLWLKSSTGGGPISSWMEIPNSNSLTYQPPQLTQTTFYIRCARREGCDNFVAESNSIVIVVNSCIGGMIQNLSATVEANNERVSIDWTTQPENELFRYHVERSFDGNDYEIIGQVNGLGDQQTSNFYNFMDDNPRMGRNMYRIVQENLASGSMLQSEPVEVMFSNSDNQFFVYPNPTSQNLNVESMTPMNGNATLYLYNATGQLLDIIEVDELLGKVEVEMNKLAAGPYFIEVKFAGKDETEIIRIIKE